MCVKESKIFCWLGANWVLAEFKYILFTGCEVRIGRNCARGLAAEGGSQTEGTVSPNADRPRPVNNIFIFSYWDLIVSRKSSFTLQPMWVEVGRVRVDETRD